MAANYITNNDAPIKQATSTQFRPQHRSAPPAGSLPIRPIALPYRQQQPHATGSRAEKTEQAKSRQSKQRGAAVYGHDDRGTDDNRGNNNADHHPVRSAVELVADMLQVRDIDVDLQPAAPGGAQQPGEGVGYVRYQR